MASDVRANNITNAAGSGAPAFPQGIVGNHKVKVSDGNGHGSTNTKIRRFTTTNTNVGSAITYADSATLGASFTINEDGLYSCSYSDLFAGGATSYGVTKNSAALTTAISGLANANDIEAIALHPTGVTAASVSATFRCVAGDVIRPHTDGTPATTGYFALFSISKVGV